MSTQKPKTAVEKVRAKAQTFIDEAMGEVGELNGVVVVFNWGTGRNDFDAGLYGSRDNTVDIDDLVNALDQCRKVEQKILRMLLTANSQRLAKPRPE